MIVLLDLGHQAQLVGESHLAQTFRYLRQAPVLGCGLALHPLAHEFRFGPHLDRHEEVALRDPEALLDVEEDGKELVVFLQDVQDSLLLLLPSLREDAVEQSQGFVGQERVALDVDELEQQLGNLGLEHHLLPFSELSLDVEVPLPEDELLAL